MLLDWTHYSRFVSNQVRDRCKKGGTPTAAGNGMLEPSKQYGSLNFTNLPIRNSVGSLTESIAVTGSLDSGMDYAETDQKDVELTEYKNGVVAIIDMVAYTDLIQKLADRKDVSTQIIARSIEVHFAKIIDILSENGGDVIKIQSDSIVCVWRFKGGPDSENFILLEENEEMAELISLATLSCIKCRDLLLQTQIWALEDLSEEYKGITLDFICGIGFGNVLDLHIGARYFRMSNLLLGSAYDEALDAVQRAKEANKINDIFISENLWDNCAYYLEEKFNISTVPLGDSNIYQLLSSNSIPSESIIECFEKSSKNIHHCSQEQDFSNGQVATFVNERVIRLVKLIRADKKHSVYYAGSWIENSAVTIVIKPEEVAGSLEDTSNCFQQYIEIVLKSAKQYEMILHKVFVTKDKDLVIQVTIIHGENSNKNPQVSSVKMALSCSDFLLKTRSVKQVSIAICSGTGYEGILQGNTKSKYRLISSSLKTSESMASAATVTGILADQATFDACRNFHINGMFRPTETQGTYELARIDDLSQRVYDNRRRRHSYASEIPEMFAPVIAAAKAVGSENDIRRNVLIEGLKGSGKTTVLKTIEKHLQKMNFIVLSAECKENETFAHPLFPYQSIFDQIIDNIDTIAVNSKQTNRHELVRNQTQSAKGFNTTSDRAEKLLERANTAKDRILAKRPSIKEGSLASKVALETQAAKDFNNTISDRADRLLERVNTAKDKILTKKPTVKENSDSSKAVLESIKTVKAHAKKLASKFITKSKIHPQEENINIHDKGDEVIRGVPSVYEVQGVKVSRLKSRLLRAGEDPKLVMPLLNSLIQPIIDETEDSTKISPDGRTLLLSGLIVRLLDKISDTKPIAILIDDTDSMDSASWTLTLNILRRCKRILVVLATHPCTCWRYPLMTKLNELPASTSIELHGSTTSDLYGIIKQNFDLWAENIDKSIIDIIKHKTEGRYSYVFSLIAYLKDTDLIRVESNTLKTADDSQSFEASIPGDFEQLLLQNYDIIRSSEFQKFLRCASVVGRNFSLEEVAAIMYDSDQKTRLKQIDKLACMLKIYDFFGLIQRKTLSCMPDQTYPYKTIYFFVYSEMRAAIYKYRIPQADRQSYHVKLLRFYESEMNQDNEPTFLPLICYHGQFTGLVERDEIVQHIQYLAMYGNFLCNICESFKEVIELYTHMQTVIEKYQLEDILGKSLLSEIHIRLGHANCYGIPHEINRIQSLRHFMLATQLLEFTWPRAETEWAGLLSYEVLAWLINNIIKVFSSNAQKKTLRKYIYGLFGFDDYSKDMKIARLEHLEPILENMSKILYETDAPMMEQLGCDILMLNNAFRLGNYNSSSVRLLMSIAIKANFSGHKLLAISFADRCLSKELDPQSCASGAFFWTSIGKWEIAREWIDKGIIMSKKMGDFTSWQLCTKERSLMYLFEGNFPQLLAIEEERKNECMKNGFTSGVLAAQTTILCIQVLRGDLEAVKKAKPRLQEKYRDVSPVLRAQFQAIDSIERMIELIPKIHYSNDTIFLCVLLSILAIRNIHDRAKSFKPKERASRAISAKRPSNLPNSKPIAPSSQVIVDTSDSFVLEDISKPAGFLPKSVSKKRSSEIVVRSIRDKNGEISFSYKSARTKSVYKSSNAGQRSLNETIPQIKKLLNGLLTNLAPFQNHIISEPFTILLKAMLKVYDPTLLKTQNNDGPMALRFWVQNCVKRRIREMKLLVALLAINCWKLSDESLEFTSDLNAGMSMLAEMGLDAELIF